MADVTTNSTSKRREDSRREYQVYFTLIVMMTLPVSIVNWAADFLTGKQGGTPWGRSVEVANTITPIIFSA